jgi:hypothetical protein
VRFRRGRKTYRKWEDFSWHDHIERQALFTTFTRRHLPLSDGEDHFGGELEDPPEWGTPELANKVPKRKKAVGKVKVEPNSTTFQGPMRFDPDEGRMVSYVDLS